MDFKALDRLMGKRRLNTAERRVAERRNHQFSADIGGCSDNYREPKFGSGTTDSFTKNNDKDKPKERENGNFC